MSAGRAALAAVAALLAAALWLRPLAHGVPSSTAAVFWATALGQALVPGVLLARGARLAPGGLGLAALGASLGLALQGVAVLAGRALAAPWLPAAAALAAAAAGLALTRRAGDDAQAADRGATALPLTVALVAVLLQPLSSAQRLGAPLPFDLLFHAGNAAELRHRWPLEDPRVAGVPLHYHLLAYALPVEAADRAGAAVADPLLALAPLLWVALLALAATAAGRALFGTTRAGALGAAVLVLHADPGRLLGFGPGAFNSHLATGIYGSPTTVCGLVLLAALVVALEAWLARGGGLRLAAIGLVALAASAAKTTVLPVALAGLGLAGGRALLQRRTGEALRLGLALATVGLTGAPLTAWQAGGDEGYTGIVGLRPAAVFWSSPFAKQLAQRLAGAETLPPALVAPGFGLWLLGYLGLAGVAAALWLARHRAALTSLQAVALGAVAAGLAAGLVLDVPGLSQLFLLYNGQLLLALFAGAALAEAPAWPFRRWGALCAAILLACALPSLALLGGGVPATLRADRAAAAAVPSAAERDYAAGLAWLRAHASRGAVVFADNPSLLLSAIGEVRLYYENGLYTARAWQAGPAREPWPERALLQERLLRRPDAAALAAARDAVGSGPRLLVVADAVQSRVEAGFVFAAPGPVPRRLFFPPSLFERTHLGPALQVYEAR